MSTNLLIQYLVIALLVVASAAFGLRKLAPTLTSRWLASLTLRLDRPGQAGWLRAFGRWLQPKQATGNCSDGCSTCGACGSEPPKAARGDVMPLEFRPRR